MAEATEQEAKNIAIISYITLIGWLIAYTMNQKTPSSLGVYHLRQSLGIMLTGVALSIISNISVSILGSVLGFGVIVFSFIPMLTLILWILGIISAVNAEEKPVPVIGDMAQNMLKGIK